MRLVHSLICLAPIAFTFVACDTNADEPVAVASVGMTVAPHLTDASDCRVPRQDMTPSLDAAQHAAASCSSDADCTVAVSDTMCFGATQHAVSFAGLDQFLLRVARADARWCATVPDSCSSDDTTTSATAVCQAGLCELRATTSTCGPGEVLTSEGCIAKETAHGKAERALAVAVEQAAACDSDSECVAVVDMTGCASACGVAINGKQAGPFSERMTDIVSDYCRAAVGGDVSCAATTPVCVAHRCELVASH